ncbi:MAG: ABC transporter permease [Petrotogales bacterium]
MSEAKIKPIQISGIKKKKDWLPYFVGGLTIFILLFFLLYPIFTTVLSSFIKKGDQLKIGNLTLYNFRQFIESRSYRDALLHSLVVSFITTSCAILLALPAAYCVSRIKMPFRNFIVSLSVIPIISPPFIMAYSWVTLLGNKGIITYLLNSWFGVTLPSIYGLFGIVIALSLHYFPYVFLIVQGALTASDPYIEESALVMGARRWRILRTITFPLVIPAIGAGAMIVFVKSLGNFGVPAILGGEYYVLSTFIYFQVQGFFNLNAASAISICNVLLTLVAILILNRINRKRGFVSVTTGTRRSRLITGMGSKIFANIYVWGLLFIALLPQIVVIFTSFAEKWSASLLPTKYGLGNYIRLFSAGTTPISNSLFLAASATLICLIFGTLTAYTSTKKKFYGKWALDLAIMLPFVLPGIVTGVAFLTTFNSGPVVLTGTAAIIIMAYFVRRMVYIFRAVSASVAQVDPKMEEASTICGATWGTTMRKVTIPLIAPGIVAGGILVFSTLITEMSTTIMIYSAKWKNIAVAIFERLTGEEYLEANAFGAIAIMITLILVFVSSKLLGKSMAEMFR